MTPSAPLSAAGKNIAYIGLGANLEQPSLQLSNAIKALEKIPSTGLLKVSSFYQSAPMGPQDQNDYINAVACITTQLSPIALLDQLQSIETGFGRIRNAQRWGPRILDLDLLLYNQTQLNHPRLVVPHCGLHQRNFVIVPLFEIEPDLQLPDGTSLAQLFADIDQNGIRKL